MSDYAALVERIDAWDRCYPGNCNIELLVNDCRDAIERLVAERDAARHAVVNVNDLLATVDKLTAERDAAQALLQRMRIMLRIIAYPRRGTNEETMDEQAYFISHHFTRDELGLDDEESK